MKAVNKFCTQTQPYKKLIKSCLHICGNGKICEEILTRMFYSSMFLLSAHAHFISQLNNWPNLAKDYALIRGFHDNY